MTKSSVSAVNHAKSDRLLARNFAFALLRNKFFGDKCGLKNTLSAVQPAGFWPFRLRYRWVLWAGFLRTPQPAAGLH